MKDSKIVYTNKDGTPNIIGFNGKYNIIKTNTPLNSDDELEIIDSIYFHLEEKLRETYNVGVRVPDDVINETMKEMLNSLSKRKYFKLEVVPLLEENDKTKFILTKNQKSGIEKMKKRTNRWRSVHRLESILENGEYNTVDRYFLNFYRDLYNKYFKNNKDINEIDVV